MEDIHGGNIWKASREAGLPVQDIMDFSASVNPLGLSPKAAAAIKNSLKLIAAYPDPESEKLIKALSKYHRVSQEEILAGNGSTEFIYLIPNVFRPKTALIVEPAFSEYRASLKRNGCMIEDFFLREEEGFELNIGGLKKRISKGYGLLYISNPVTPAGTVIKKETLLEVARLCKRTQTVFIVDEAFVDFCEDESIKKEAVNFRNVVVLRSMTKFFSIAGLRLGYIVAHRDTIKKFSRLIPPWSVNTVASVAAIGSIEDTGYVEKTRKWLLNEKKFLSRGLSSVEGLKVFGSAANFFMVKINDASSLTSPLLKEILFRKGILIRDLNSFRGLGPKYFRVAIKKRKENEILINALKGILRGGPSRKKIKKP